MRIAQMRIIAPTLRPEESIHILTRVEVAELLRVHVKSVGRLPIPSFTHGRGKRARRFWRYEDVQRYVEGKVTP